MPHYLTTSILTQQAMTKEGLRYISRTSLSHRNSFTNSYYSTMAHKPPTTAPTLPPIKILMLHGFTQSGALFRAKTRALEKNLQKAFPSGITLHYATAPIRLSKTDLTFGGAHVDPSHTSSIEETEQPDAYAWWRRKGDAEPFWYEGMDQGLARVAEILQLEGPFDGVIGFSQGGALAGMLASLLEEGRREAFEKCQSSGGMRYPESFEKDTGFMTDVVHRPLKFAVSYSGFGAATNPLYTAFYEPKIKTPMLHFLGSLDTVVEEKRSLRLVEACEDGGKGRVVYHPGGHFLPSSQREYVAALVGFIRDVMSKGQEGEKEERAEDMDVPF